MIELPRFPGENHFPVQQEIAMSGGRNSSIHFVPLSPHLSVRPLRSPTLQRSVYASLSSSAMLYVRPCCLSAPLSSPLFALAFCPSMFSSLHPSTLFVCMCVCVWLR